MDQTKIWLLYCLKDSAQIDPFVSLKSCFSIFFKGKQQFLHTSKKKNMSKEFQKVDFTYTSLTITSGPHCQKIYLNTLEFTNCMHDRVIKQ